MDNWFTSIPVAEQLVEKYNTTIVGIIRRNKREIPPEFIACKLAIKFTKFGFSVVYMLASYVPKWNKTVLVLSSIHDWGDKDKDSGDAKLPVVTSFYMTKGGVEVVDKTKGEYSVYRVCNR